MSALLQPLVLALHLLMPAGLRPPVLAQVAQPAAAQASPSAPARRTTDRVLAEVAAATAGRAQTVLDKQRLAGEYDADLGEIDRLKRGRASWRRDRQVAAKKASSQATAKRLAVLDDELRKLDTRLAAARKALVVAIDGELAAGGSRAAYLRTLRAELVTTIRPKARKIILPDDSLDELADPDELAEQIALIRSAESDLQREQRVLAVREDRYGRMARLREQRERAAELSQPDEEAVRRTTGRDNPKRGTDGEAGASSSEDSGSLNDLGMPAPPGESSPQSEDGAGFEASSVLLADVVDSTTANALRRAGRSSDPRTRLEAAALAKRQVEARLERLRRSRLLIERHLRKLDR